MTHPLDFLGKYRNKKRNRQLLEFLREESIMVRKALALVAMAEKEAAPMLALPAETVLRHRVDIIGADEIYDAINLSNYRALINSIDIAKTEDEFFVAMCVLDKAEEFGDYNTMMYGFKMLESTLRRNKESKPTINYARKYVNRVREHLMDLSIYY
jgi:hypothetical protein